VAAGYKAFGVGCPSDHRVLWADSGYQEHPWSIPEFAA
jgi:hypothetical protein